MIWPGVTSHCFPGGTVDPPGMTAIFVMRAACDVESLPRILGLLAQRGIVPIQLNCRRKARSLFVDIEVEGADAPALERLLAKFQAMILIERASLLFSAKSPGRD